jgi:thioredoxin reductase (NADPH)
MEKVVIIGAGPAGFTAGIYCARADLNPLILSGKLPGGLLTQTSDVENYPGFSSVNGFELMMMMQKQAEKFSAKIVPGTAKSVVFQNGGPHTLELESGDKIVTKTVIIATGSNPRWMGLDSEKRLANKGVSACATCDGAFFRNLPVVIVGGGDTAMEEALFLTKFASQVTIIHRRNEFRASKIMIARVKENSKVNFVLDSQVIDILGEKEVEGVKVKNLKSEEITTIECRGYFAALGHIPATEIFRNYIKTDEKGYILLKENTSRTNIDGVFAAGDCADNRYMQAVTAAGMGCKAAMDAEQWLTTNKC